jgi:transketolase
MSHEKREEARLLLELNPYSVTLDKIYPVKKTDAEIKALTKQIRRDIVLSVYAAGSGHPGGSLSAVDLLSVLYVEYLRHTPSNPKWEERDRVIYSKGHVSPLIYSLFAETGYIDRTLLSTFRDFRSPLQGHPSSSWLDCVEVSSGSLGQGLSVGVGLALAFKRDQKKQRIYVLCGDGESQEGQIWEAVMSAAHYHLDNLTLLFDYNNLEIDGWVEDVMGIAPVEEKFKSFNWHTIPINGHDLSAIRSAYEQSLENKDRPTVIIGKTIKGKGISYMENQADWHGRAPDREQMLQALSELDQEE